MYPLLSDSPAIEYVRMQAAYPLHDSYRHWLRAGGNSAELVLLQRLPAAESYQQPLQMHRPNLFFERIQGPLFQKAYNSASH